MQNYTLEAVLNLVNDVNSIIKHSIWIYYALGLFWILSGLKRLGTQDEVLTVLTLKFKIIATFSKLRVFTLAPPEGIFVGKEVNLCIFLD